MPAIPPARKDKYVPLRMFATCSPGLGPLLSAQLSVLDGVDVGWIGNDGRADLVSFTASPGIARAVSRIARIADDFFVQIGHARRSDGDRAAWLAQRLCRSQQLRFATAWANLPSASATCRVIARVLSERSFPRTDLRRKVEAVLGQLCPSWRSGDPASNEVWICEYRHGFFVAGLRVTGRRHRQRGGRLVERDGALRPGIAAALVSLAGTPNGALVDPCCGSGTVLAEASAVGWTVAGFDIDSEAVTVARLNVPGVTVAVGDARCLDMPGGSIGAWVSNVPFGVQYKVPGDSAAWLRLALDEAARVVRPSGRVAILSAGVPRQSIPPMLHPIGCHRVRVLGQSAVIDSFTRQ